MLHSSHIQHHATTQCFVSPTGYLEAVLLFKGSTTPRVDDSERNTPRPIQKCRTTVTYGTRTLLLLSSLLANHSQRTSGIGLCPRLPTQIPGTVRSTKRWRCFQTSSELRHIYRLFTIACVSYLFKLQLFLIHWLSKGGGRGVQKGEGLRLLLQ